MRPALASLERQLRDRTTVARHHADEGLIAALHLHGDRQSVRRLRLIAAEGRYVVHLSAGPRALRLVPDTGAEAFVFFHAPGKASPALAIGSARLRGLAGDLGVRAASAPRLVVGDVTLRDQPAVIVDRRDDNADGLLPLHAFASVSFNMRDRCMVVR
jgi:hypothetical protein